MFFRRSFHSSFRGLPSLPSNLCTPTADPSRRQKSLSSRFRLSSSVGTYILHMCVRFDNTRTHRQGKPPKTCPTLPAWCQSPPRRLCSRNPQFQVRLGGSGCVRTDPTRCLTPHSSDPIHAAHIYTHTRTHLAMPVDAEASAYLPPPPAPALALRPSPRISTDEQAGGAQAGQCWWQTPPIGHPFGVYSTAHNTLRISVDVPLLRRSLSAGFFFLVLFFFPARHRPLACVLAPWKHWGRGKQATRGIQLRWATTYVPTLLG